MIINKSNNKTLTEAPIGVDSSEYVYPANISNIHIDSNTGNFVGVRTQQDKTPEYVIGNVDDIEDTELSIKKADKFDNNTKEIIDNAEQRKNMAQKIMNNSDSFIKDGDELYKIKEKNKHFTESLLDEYLNVDDMKKLYNNIKKQVNEISSEIGSCGEYDAILNDLLKENKKLLKKIEAEYPEFKDANESLKEDYDTSTEAGRLKDMLQILVNAYGYDDIQFEVSQFGYDLADYEIVDEDAHLSSYDAWVDGTNLGISKDRVADNKALDEILDFIDTLTPEQKRNFGLSWRWIEDDGSEEDLVVSVYSPSEAGDPSVRSMTNWPDAEDKILDALGE